MAKINILIVEDDPRMRELIMLYFRAQNYGLLEADNGKDALEIFSRESVDLVILDLMIPQVDGWQVCRKMRELSDIPIIILTARSQEDDELLGFELGADDYVTKPFNPKLLVARAAALLARAQKSRGKHPAFIEINHLKLRIDDDSHDVFINNEKLNLSPREYELLYFLASHRGQLLSREQILDGVWGYDYFGDLRTVDTHIWRLREKLGALAELITTVRGFGYRFEVNK